MKNMTTSERINRVTDKYIALNRIVNMARRGKASVEDFEMMKVILNDTHKDALALIDVIDDYELEKEFNNKNLEIPSFLKRAQ